MFGKQKKLSELTQKELGKILETLGDTDAHKLVSNWLSFINDTKNAELTGLSSKIGETFFKNLVKHIKSFEASPKLLFTKIVLSWLTDSKTIQYALSDARFFERSLRALNEVGVLLAHSKTEAINYKVHNHYMWLDEFDGKNKLSFDTNAKITAKLTAKKYLVLVGEPNSWVSSYHWLLVYWNERYWNRAYYDGGRHQNEVGFDESADYRVRNSLLGCIDKIYAVKGKGGVASFMRFLSLLYVQNLEALLGKVGDWKDFVYDISEALDKNLFEDLLEFLLFKDHVTALRETRATTYDLLYLIRWKPDFIKTHSKKSAPKNKTLNCISEAKKVQYAHDVSEWHDDEVTRIPYPVRPDNYRK